MRHRYLATTAVLLGLAAVVLKKASTLPPPIPATNHPCRKRGTASPLADAAGLAALSHPDLSGVHLLADAHDAFAARMLLVREARQTLDLQYYIWHGDRSGTLLLEAVRAAADRGVRIRLLLDDNGIAGLDKVLSALDQHPMIEVRIFNPFAIRFPKSVGFVFDFKRLNRRMHNKSLTADGAVTIVGGRNIGDEYFGSGEGGLFADLDVLAIGPIVDDVTGDFDLYWWSGSSYPASQIISPAGGRGLRKLSRASSRLQRDPDAAEFLHRMRSLPLVRQLLDGSLPLEWARVQLLSDDPAKGLGEATPDGLLAGHLKRAVGRPRHKLGIIAGYFVPGPEGVRVLSDMARDGVDISVLTNAFEASDVKMVHAGYAPARKPLLKAGVRLFEIRSGEAAHPDVRKGVRRGVGSRLRGSGTGSTAALRSGATTLHAKTFTVDDRRLFVGSFNFDPRSWQLNTEMGFVIESPALAREVATAFNNDIPLRAYELCLRDDRIEWVEEGSPRVVHKTEPGLGKASACALRLANLLPIRWLL